MPPRYRLVVLWYPLRVVAVELGLGRRGSGLRKVAAAAANDGERVARGGIPRVEEPVGLGGRMTARSGDGHLRDRQIG